MGKMDEYIAAGTGIDKKGHPASQIQFIFGKAPFMMAETDNVDDVVDILDVYESSAVAQIKFEDDIAIASFDLAKEKGILGEMAVKLDTYTKNREKMEEVLNEIIPEYDDAIQEQDVDKIKEIQMKLRNQEIPFLAVKLFPEEFHDKVQIGFDDDPKFVLFTSEQLNENPTRITMVYDAHDVYCQDERAVYHIDDSDEEE